MSDAKDMRDAFFDQVCEIGAVDKDVIILSNDMDVLSLKRFRENFPDQFINAGVAEQNMISIAAGLASTGKKVYVYGITPFVVFRCYEQIKFSICSMNLPVTIVGVGSGFSFGFDGPTHHAVHDVSVMRALPEMHVFNPSDEALAAACAMVLDGFKSPSYIRLDKGVFPRLHTKFSGEYLNPFIFDKGARILFDSEEKNDNIIIFSTGTLASDIFWSTKEYRNVFLVDVWRLHPTPADELSFVFKKRDCKQIITIEEHAYTGGLGSMITEFCADNSINIPIKRIAVRDEHSFNYGNRDWFRRNHKIDRDSLREAVESCL